jgi:hypothetical protein
MSARAQPSGRWRPGVLCWTLALFALHLAAWTAWFIIAAHHPVAEVPLVTAH